MLITISDEIPFITLARFASAAHCEIVNDRKGGLTIKPKANSGNCDLCGEWAGDLDEGVCLGCKSRYPSKVLPGQQ